MKDHPKGNGLFEIYDEFILKLLNHRNSFVLY